MNKKDKMLTALLSDIKNANYSRSKPTEPGGYLIPVGSPYYGMSKEQLDKHFNKS